MISNVNRLRLAFLEHYSISSWLQPIAVTLTMRNALSSPHGLIHGTPERYSEALRHGLNVINRKLYGQRWQQKRRLKVIPVREQDQSGRSHYHLAIDLGEEGDLEAFAELVQEVWSNTDWGYHVIDVRPADQGWLRYMLKLRGKADLMSAIDLDNLHY